MDMDTDYCPSMSGAIDRSATTHNVEHNSNLQKSGSCPAWCHGACCVNSPANSLCKESCLCRRPKSIKSSHLKQII